MQFSSKIIYSLQFVHQRQNCWILTSYINFNSSSMDQEQQMTEEDHRKGGEDGFTSNQGPREHNRILRNTCMVEHCHFLPRASSILRSILGP